MERAGRTLRVMETGIALSMKCPLCQPQIKGHFPAGLVSIPGQLVSGVAIWVMVEVGRGEKGRQFIELCQNLFLDN